MRVPLFASTSAGQHVPAFSLRFQQDIPNLFERECVQATGTQTEAVPYVIPAKAGIQLWKESRAQW